MSGDAPYPGWDGYPGMDQHQGIEFLMATEDGSAIDGWHWLIEPTSTSFYLKSMHRALQGAKVSIHGPDDRHPGQQHYRFDLIRTPQMEVDEKKAGRAASAGGRWLTEPTSFPWYFPGRRINDDTDLVVRLSVGHDLFVPGAEPAGPSDWPKQKATMRGLVPIPAEGHVTHIDIFVSRNGKPYWRDEEAIRAAQAGMGYLMNSLGWCLSVIINKRDIDDEPDPSGDLRGETPVDQCSRGLASTIDDTGLLWLCEKLIPRDQPSVSGQ